MRAFFNSLLAPREHPPMWLRLGSLLTSITAVVLLGTVLIAYLHGGTWSSHLLILVLCTLVVAICIHVHFLLLARQGHSQTARELEASEHAYRSVFNNVLDGILILDDHAICQEANPAAASLLASDAGALVGRSIETFFPEVDRFRRSWTEFLRRAYAQAETVVLRGDGRSVFVEYTASANFLPGRHVAILRDVTDRKESEMALRESEERFQEMASNIVELFWMVDAERMEVVYVNPAYEAITGRSCTSLLSNPKSFVDILHPEDRTRILSRIADSAEAGVLDEEFRIVRPNGTIVWVWGRGFPVKDSRRTVGRLVGTAVDVTMRKRAEEQLARSLRSAEAAKAEAEALRRTTLALTQDLSMDYVLDTLLKSLMTLVPCELAQVILVESGTRLFLAREAHNCEPTWQLPRSLVTLEARDNPFLLKALANKKSVLIADTSHAMEWEQLAGFAQLRSWLCVPLLASQDILGVLSLGDKHANAFTDEHLRLAESLAIPGAVAIQNARLYEEAEIFRTELEQRLAELEQAHESLARLGQNHRLS